MLLKFEMILSEGINKKTYYIWWIFNKKHLFLERDQFVTKFLTIGGSIFFVFFKTIHDMLRRSIK